MGTGRRFKMVHDLLALFGGHLLSKVISLLAFACLSRRLGDLEAYSAVEYAAGLAVFFSTVVEAGTSPIGVRKLARHPERAGLLAARIPSARLLVALVAVPVMGLSSLLVGEDGRTTRLVWLFAFAVLGGPWNLRWLFQGLEMMKLVALAQVLRNTVFLAGVFFLVWGPEDLLRVGWVEVAAAGSLTVYFLSLQRLHVARIRLSLALRELWNLLREGFSLGLVSMLWGVIQFTPLLLMKKTAGDFDIAWYGSSQRIAVALMAFSHVYHFNLYPAIARYLTRSSAKARSLIESSIRITAWISILAAVLLNILAAKVLGIAYGEGFERAAPTFSLLVWTMPVTILSGHARWALIAGKNQRDVLVAHSVGALVALVVGLFTVPWLGAIGGALSQLAACLVIWVVAHRIARSRLGPIRLLPSIAVPAGFAVVTLGAFALSPLGPWTSAALAVPLWLLFIVLFDRRILNDARELGHAKSQAPDARPPST